MNKASKSIKQKLINWVMSKGYTLEKRLEKQDPVLLQKLKKAFKTVEIKKVYIDEYSG